MESKIETYFDDVKELVNNPLLHDVAIDFKVPQSQNLCNEWQIEFEHCNR